MRNISLKNDIVLFTETSVSTFSSFYVDNCTYFELNTTEYKRSSNIESVA